MKNLKLPKNIVILIIAILFFVPSFGQTFLYEDFEDGVKPAGWTNEFVSGIVNWQYLDGGFSNTGLEGSGHPQYAKQGFVNAMFHKESFSGQTTKLVTPPLNLEFGIKPELAFWHAQDERYAFEQYNNDELRVYYKSHIDSSWIKIAEYTDIVNIWKERKIQIPPTPTSDIDSAFTGTYYIAFEGKTKNGYGVCIDSVAIVEKGVIPKYLESIDVRQASTDFVATESKNNGILRIDFTVKGNDGSLIFDSLSVNSLNTDDSDILPNGVKLFASDDESFSNAVQIGTGQSFVDGLVNFTNINRVLPTGISSVWVTYDMITDVDHTKHEHILDAEILKENIKVNTSYYPLINQSPDGERTLYESILFDDFETDKEWIFTGEFERGIPLGLGGLTKGSPDPDFAVSGSYIIGTDLADNGDYDTSLTDREYSATSPFFNCKYYKNTYFYFSKWFNIDFNDKATIDISTDKENNWKTYWQSSGTSINNKWSTERFNLDTVISRHDSIQIRFTLGPTNNFWNFSGWNIDNVVLVGNYINKDVAVTEWLGPFGGCGNTDEEYVTVKIKNLAGEDMTDPLPVCYSFDNGVTTYCDTIYTTIPVDDSLVYIIDKPIDLTIPGWYRDVYAATFLAGDEDNTNNKIELEMFITPTYSLPYYEDFESNDGYYVTGGENSTWKYGKPYNLFINTAASGEYAWVTNLTGNYLDDESSYIESPCFDFTGSDSIVFQFKSKGISQDKIDGLSLLYSIDDGGTWDLVPNDSNFYWNWYNEPIISSSGLPGIDTTNSQWLTFRQLLPPECSDESQVKFRFAFNSSVELHDEGFGIDDIRIYEAPYDIGIRSLIEPTTQCELSDSTVVKAYIENYGLRDVKSGTKIPISLKVNSKSYTDTCLLASDLPANDSILFTFNHKIDMSYAGDYNFIINTKLESNTYFYNDTASNDSLTATVSVIGMPRYNPFPKKIGVNPVDTFIVAGPGYVSYDWERPVLIDTTTTTTDTLAVKNAGWYKVLVENAVECTALDSVLVVDSEIDLELAQLYGDFVDSCERIVLTELMVDYKNNSFNPLSIGDTVLLGYQINDNNIISDSIFLTSGVAVGATAQHTFSELADFRTPGEYTLKVFTNFEQDLNHADDTITKVFNTWGIVSIDLAYDTIYSSQADTLFLIADPGYDTYTWNNGSSNDTVIPSNVSYYYKVTASDANICLTDSDSTYIETYDFGISDVLGFEDDCNINFVTDSALKVEITNYSGNTYIAGDTIRVVYKFDDNGWIANKLTLTSTFNPTSSQVFEIANIDATASKLHSFKVYTSSAYDADHSNDTIVHNFESWPFPVANLAYDTIFTSRADTVILETEDGWDSYLWNTGSTNEYISVSNTASQKYIVEVSDEHSCGIAKDSTQILTFNIGVSDIITPVNDCEHTAAEPVRIKIQNFSTDTMQVGDIINVSYNVNNGTTYSESFPLPYILYPSQTVQYQFTQKADLTAADIYEFKIFTDYEFDVRRSNDTLIDAVATFENPSIELGPDIYTGQPDTVQIIADPGYVKYDWSNGTYNDTLSITYLAYQEYILTVTNTNGCADSDSISLYTYDVGIASINTPSTTCVFNNNEVLNISVLNNSQDTLLIGETINLSYSLNGGAAVNEVLTLTSDLLPITTVDYSFTSTLDLTSQLNHNIKVTCSRTIDVNDANDTLSVNIEEVGYPTYDLGADIYIINPVGTEFTAPGGYDSYLWQDGSTNATFTISYPASQQYSVTVTDTYGCSTPDTIEVYTYDIGISSINTPVTKCKFEIAEVLDVSVLNNSLDTLLTGESINLSYSLNGGTAVDEVLVLTNDLLPDSTIDYSFTSTLDLTSQLNHNIKVTCSRTIDVNDVNDTLSVNIEEVGYPTYDLGADIYTADPVGTEFTAPGGYDSYLWQDGSTNETFTISYPASQQYSVTVSDIYGCSTPDTIEVYTYDIGISSINTPVTTCKFGIAEVLDVSVINNSQDTLLTGETIDLNYSLNGGALVNEILTLTEDLLPDSTVEYSFTSTLDLTSQLNHNIKVTGSRIIDVYDENDTLSVNINEVGYPSFNLGDDLFIADPIGTVFMAPGGYDSYLWQDGSTNSSFNVTYPASAKYSVRVTDINGCSGVDTVEVFTYNIIADSINSPIARCDFTDSEIITIGVRNNGADTLQIGDSLEVGFRLNSGNYVSELFALTGVLHPDSTELFTLSSNPADLTENRLHEFKVFAKLTNIDVVVTDTTTLEIDNLAPAFDLGGPEVSPGSEYIIDPGTWASYLWFDDSTDPTYTVDINYQNFNFYYAVTITTDDGCTATDSIEVTFTTTPDLEITDMTSPISDCWQETETYPVNIVIENTGVLNIVSGTSFIVGYTIDNGAPVTETFNLVTAMSVGDTREHTFANEVSFSAAKVYEFEPFVKLFNDGNETNDTSIYYVDISAPDVVLGSNDTIFTYDESYIISTTESYLSYLWSNANNSTTPTLTVTQSGLYSVTITDELGCQGEGSIYISFLNDVENIIKGDGYQLSYFPNPVSEELTIEFENKDSKDMNIEIINSTGQILYNNKINNNGNTTERINVNPFANGVYFIRFRIDDKLYLRKLIIQ